MMNREKVFAYIDQHTDAHMKQIQEFISQPSISPRDTGVQECGTLLKQYFEELGCKDVGWAGDYPILYGEYEVGVDKTLLVYLMFDTGPSAFPLLANNRYASGVEIIEPFGKCLTVKGTIGYKAYLRAFLNALNAIKAIEGSLPVNLIFVCDGEEMLGSPHLPHFVEEYRHRLETINVAFWPRSTQNTAGNVQITLGGKGMVGFRLECSGQSWGRGPMTAPSHSSNQVILDSPVWRLVQALATLTSQDGNTVRIDGFYDDVQPPTEEELDLVDTILEEFSTEALMRNLNVQHFIDDLQGKELLLRYFFSPTFNLELEQGDYNSFGVGVLPHKATAKIQIRLVPHQTIQGLLQKIRAHLDRHGYADIQITPFYGIEWGRSKFNSSITQAILQTYLEQDLTVAVWPTSPATPPPAIFNRSFGVSFMSGGVGYCGKTKAHEFFVVDGNPSIAGLQACEKTFVTILDKFSTAP